MATIEGVEGTPYEGGQFSLDIRIYENYPIAPPSVTFLTKVWHPNIEFSTGELCMDTMVNAVAVRLVVAGVAVAVAVIIALAVVPLVGGVGLGIVGVVPLLLVDDPQSALFLSSNMIPAYYIP